MLTDSQAVRTYFAKLGLEPEIADLYLALYTYGPQTISELSRTSKVERTRIYRLIDRLLETNLIEVETRHKRGIIKAAPIANLNILISQKAQELKSLQDELDMLQQVLARNSLSSPAAQVQFYEGTEGAHQMFWNMLQAKTPILIILNEVLVPLAKSRFYTQWLTQANQQQVNVRALFSQSFLGGHRAWHNKHFARDLKEYAGRSLPSSALPFSHTQIIYNDTVAYYYETDGQLFGVEHHNTSTAETERVFFELLWKISNPAD